MNPSDTLNNIFNDGLYGKQFNWCLNFLIKKGKEIFGEDYHIKELDYEIIYKLLVFFLHDKGNAQKLGLDLNKGILLEADKNCEKINLMNLIKHVALPDYMFESVPCKKIKLEFIENGMSALNNYCYMSFKDEFPKTFCFEYLGSEISFKDVEIKSNTVMPNLILTRYDYFIKHKLITHFTTTFSIGEIEEFYGKLVGTKLQEMTNQISYR